MLRRVITSAITRAHLRAVTVVIVVIAATVLSSAPYLTSAQTPGPCEPPNAPCTIWPSTQVPAVLAKNDANAVELGVKFRSDVAGYISGIRFFKSSQNTGTHIGSLWSATGTLVASAAFTNETASGWQQVNFPSPIQIAANTTYVASYHTNTGFYSANENYFATSGFNSPPLRALANGVDGLNGVYRYGATAFPNQSFNSTNYWVDVVFVTSLAPDTTPPIVQSTTPAPNATNVNIAATVTATFNEAMSASSIGPSSFELRDSGSNVVAAIITYDAATRTASLQPSATLAYSSTYSARVRGGVTGVEDVAGNSLTSDFVWTFTTSPVPTPLGCPCSIWLPSQAPVQAAEPDAGPFELGLKFRSDVAGYITGVRFYKSLQNTGTHVGNLWTAAGAQLATATFTGESASGWQEVLFQNPVAIAANTTYVVSYHTNTGFYAEDENYFATSGVNNAPLRALANGVDGPNGVYKTGVIGFPSQTFHSSNYWVDVVFVNDLGPDTTPPSIVSTVPVSNALGVGAADALTAFFSEAMSPASINTTAFELRDSNNNLVPAVVTYDQATRLARLQPSTPLTYSAIYTARVKGGSSGVEDAAGNALASDYVWTFTTQQAPPDEGPGGPVLVIASPTNPFTRYYAEILRAEGLNSFSVADIATVDDAQLAQFDVVILGNFALASSQVTMLSNWVNAGGNLIAMRPDKQLASLLGLTDAGTTLSEGYLLIDTSASPGAGLVNQTIQYHGTADRYTLNGAAALAMLYSSASVATSNPAVTIRSVGTSGGQAVAFTYDLARSVVYTRQGNPAWAGQERDGIAPVRPDDLFFGGSEPNWVDLNKVAIPQADEQQRLLANLINHLNVDRKPIPRFWYFPRGLKAVVVMTGDDHGHNGTSGQFDTMISESPADCNLLNWECIRGTSYLFHNTPISNSAVGSYTAMGFEIGVHMRISGPNTDPMACNNYTPQSVASDYQAQIAQFTSIFPAAGSIKTNRTHCIVWSDWSSQAQTARDNGIRLDVNYYYWPPTWVNNVPGVFTGSGMPMRFAAANGSLIDVYQAPSQMTDESGQTYPFTSDVLLDRALGPLGYYGAFVANMHTDNPTHAGLDAIIASAKARGVPVITSKQLLTWLDGRNGSTFSDLAWAGNTLTFSIAVAPGSIGLQAMLPMAASVGPLNEITRNGSPVTFSTQTIKGVQYAVFSAVQGSYGAVYATDTTPPVIANVSAVASSTTATISWLTDESATSIVNYGFSPSALTSTASTPGLGTSHDVLLTGLAASTTYYYRVTSADNAGNSASAPSAPASFTTSAAPLFTVVDTTVSDFSSGSPGAGTYVGPGTGDGEVLLTPAVVTEFAGTALPTGWSTTAWTGGGTSTVGGGVITIDGARSYTDATFGPGRSLEFRATFGDGAFQHIGFGVTFNETPWAMFSTGSGGSLLARTDNGTTVTNTPLAGNWLGAPHVFRIVWNASSIVFSIDGMAVATHNVTISTNMRPIASDFTVGDGVLSLDWLRLTPYAASGSFTSRVLDGSSTRTWASMFWTSSVPSGSALAMSVRFGNSPVPDGTWTSFTAVPASGGGITGTSRYAQYRAAFSGDTTTTPVLMDVTISVAAPPVDTAPPVISAISATPGTTTATITWTTDEPATSVVSYGLSAGALTSTASAPGFMTSHSVQLTGLAEGTVHYFRVSSADESSNSASAPATPATFTTSVAPAVTLTDTSVSDFSAGSPSAGVYVGTGTGDGEVLLTPTVGTEFAGSSLPAAWSTVAWGAGGTSTVAGGLLSVDGARTFVDDPFTPGHSLQFMATFSGAAFQHIGFGVDFDQAPWAMFSTNNGDAIVARTNDGTTPTDTLIPGDWLGTPHLYRIDWTATSVVFSIDGTVVATHNVAIGTSLRPIVSDFTTGSGSVSVDWLRMTPYATSGVFTSRVLDGGSSRTWATMSWTSLVPSGAGLSMAIRFGDTPTPDGTWTPFGSVVSSGGPVTGTSRYVQYRATFSANGQVTPELSAVTVSPAGAVSLSITNSSITEGNSGVTMASFVVSLPSPSSQTITVSYTTTPGTASNGSDYITTAGDLTFSPGVTQQTIEVPVVGDLLDESNETFTVDLSDAVNANIDDSQGVATINDDDSAPSMSIADITVTEGNSGTVNAIFVVTLSSESGQAVTVNYATADSTAVGGQDYTTASGTLTFPAGSTSQSITVAVLGDTAVENNETFVVNLSGAVNATVADAQGLGTVTTDDTALAIGDVTVTEGNGTTVNATFTVTRTGLTTQATTVDFATANGTATAGLDYSAASGTLTFASGVTTQTITVSTLGDTLDEANETFFVNLNNAAGAAIADNQAIGTITDNDGTPSLTINNATVTEGNAGTVTATFTVTLSVASGQTATVNYATANGTASGSDYSATSGTLSFGPDETTKTVNVTVSGDTTVEANETFFVNLTNGVNATIADSQGLGTITNDDASLVINNVSVVEGHTGTVNANFTVTLSGLTTQTVTVNYATANGTATAGEDYTATSGTLTFAPGETTKPVAVAVLGDTVNESGQTFFVNLTNGVNAVIADTQGQGTITNDDTGLVINNVTAAEGNTGATTNATFTVTRSGVTTGTTTVDFANADGTALAGQDYTSVSGTLTFAAGVTTQTIVVPVRGDLLDEANETYFVNLSNAVGATITDNQGLGTINDNDATPSLVINNVPVTEGNAGSVNATFTVTLSAASGRVVTVNYLTDTTTGTATAGQDYTLTTGTLTFPLGTTTQTITVPVLGDTLDEANETYFVRLSAASNASLADSQGNGTITDDDPTPSLVIDNVSLTEGNAGTTTFTFTVTLSAASGRNVTVNYTTANGTASSASDYTARSGTLTFAPGVTSQTVSVLVTGDATTEANETFVVNLSGASNATIADNQGLGTITNDD